MFGKATLDVPADGKCEAIHCTGLSDELAMIYGRAAVRTFSDEHVFVTVTLETGEVKVIGYCTLTDTLTIGRLTQ